MNRRAPMIAGVAFAVLYATAVLLLPAVPGSDSGIARVQALLLASSVLALVVVLAFARDRLTGPPAHLFTIGSSLLAAQLCVSVWFTAGPALRPGQVTVGTARALDDLAAMWLPVATVANILVAVPILLTANEDRLPRWLGTAAAVFTVEQLIETITIIGPPGSFISPGGPMNHYLGGTLTAAFFLALGIALVLPENPPLPSDEAPAAGGPAVEESPVD
ncbi:MULTISPECIES: hypothetical protein [Mycolicibacterium]|uniref:Integral membrane protein n=2 Tax=Mycolicibacterium TaxID=1866885 RepID=A1TBZ3_MYCVP|nr:MULTISPECIES: hypothetical protein [Mycolicibacterium]ABM14693.1 hypothetical protein Mvan_3916 [Mycolicibacterium vanbaalenii PYR-1]MCV7127303.1 hypothetical protein [Mycolicibacterium vanbaalenii PYR-1]MDN4520901.1 hypothetical protein [Mycolicibacterium austroafricanum]PQP39142.1 hypothetical protein C6A88_33960 [Mycolicibacterium austroafricanum]QRZ04700.1 hypothetical protein JN090_16935 [Mycolicibacterium austroafricanum]